MYDEKSTEVHEKRCPITLQVFRDPVLATDGHVYERQAITQWIEQHGTSPLTRQILNVKDLSSDRRKPSMTSTSIEISESRPSNNPSIHPAASILSTTFLLAVTTKYSPKKNITSLSSKEDMLDSCLHSSQITTLVELVNTTRSNYTYYSYLYTALTSNTTVVFEFLANSSYWCLDDISIRNIYSGTELTRNSGFESGVLQPFSFCSTGNSSVSNLLRTNVTRYSGSYVFCAPSVSYSDYLFQNLQTIKNQIYNISFWISNQGETNNRFKVSIAS